MNDYVNAVNGTLRATTTMKDLAVGDTVLYDYNGYKNYSSFRTSEPLEVVEVGRGPSGKLTFRGKQAARYANHPAVETQFLSVEYFKIVKKGVVAVPSTPTIIVGALIEPKDRLIMDETTKVMLKLCGKSELNVEIDQILRKDMNRKLLVFRLDSKVSVGELPINWTKV